MELRRPALATRRPGRLLSEFDEVFRDFRTGLEDLFMTPSSLSWTPRNVMGTTRHAVMDLRDVGEAFVLKVEMPGVPKENLEVEVTDDDVEIQAQIGHEETEDLGDYYLRERGYNAWYRRVPFPAEVVPDQAEAHLEDGILTLRVPKQEPTSQRKGTKVKVK